ncbi:MAG: aldo/keto reductase [Candidatus Saccharimonadales bacterium]
MLSKKLNNGTTMPQLGFGTWRIKDEAECTAAVKAAIEAGYRHFDTAQIYENEALVGKALKGSGIDRKDLFITTKIWNDNMWWTDLEESFDGSLKNLQTDYVDLLLLHFPVTELRRPAWRLMEKIAQSGRAKAIGVSNYTITHLEELLKESSIKPVVNQVELHVYLQQPQLVAFCQKHDIVVEAYSPLAHGYGLDNPTLAQIGKQYGKTPAQIMIRWCIEQGTVPLPKSTHAQRIKENIDVFDFKLSKNDLQKIDKLEQDYRTCWDPTHIA